MAAHAHASALPSAFAPAARLDALFAALADGTRRAIVARLALGEATVQELAAPFKISLPAISKHLKVLTRAGLITQTREAQRRPCRLQAAALSDVTAWAEETRRTWEARLDQLDDYLQELQAVAPAPSTAPTAIASAKTKSPKTSPAPTEPTRLKNTSIKRTKKS